MIPCLSIGFIALIVLLIAIIVDLKIRNAVQADRLRWQEQQLVSMQQGNGCGEWALLAMISLAGALGTLLLLALVVKV